MAFVVPVSHSLLFLAVASFIIFTAKGIFMTLVRNRNRRTVQLLFTIIVWLVLCLRLYLAISQTS